MLLQGPVGPFFAHLAEDLRAVGAHVHKVNFNAGDWLFYRQGAVAFDQPLNAWPAFFTALLDQWQIDVVLLFGDCRPVHAAAHPIATARGVEVGVFEEGYLRPNHITLERNGVNGHSDLPRCPQHYLALPQPANATEEPTQPVPNTYWHMVWWGFCYFTVGALGKPWFPHRVHHRQLNILEALPWLRSAWRKMWYRLTERKVLPHLLKNSSGRFFVVPLQVHNDTQVHVHSAYEGIEPFIEEVMRSFAASAAPDTALVIKHHPMDRGYTNYSRYIAKLAAQLGLTKRCFYIHDQHLPTLLDHAAGVVVINSTVGLQALRHGVATKAMGEAIYSLPGLSHQGGLDSFWNEARSAKPDTKLLRQFVRHLKETSQINGSFYRAMPGTGWRAGVAWPEGDAAIRWPTLNVPAHVEPMPALNLGRRLDFQVSSNDSLPQSEAA